MTVEQILELVRALPPAEQQRLRDCLDAAIDGTNGAISPPQPDTETSFREMTLEEIQNDPLYTIKAHDIDAPADLSQRVDYYLYGIES